LFLGVLTVFLREKAMWEYGRIKEGWLAQFGRAPRTTPVAKAADVGSNPAPAFKSFEETKMSTANTVLVAEKEAEAAVSEFLDMRAAILGRLSAEALRCVAAIFERRIGRGRGAQVKEKLQAVLADFEKRRAWGDVIATFRAGEIALIQKSETVKKDTPDHERPLR
jgi:hypothetical protein